MLVYAWGAEGASAGAGGDLSHLEVSEEFLPCLVGGGAVFVGGAQGAAAGEEGQVGLDDLVGIDGFVVQRDVDVLVSSDDLGDVWRQPDENGIGQEQAAKVMRGEEQRPPVASMSPVLARPVLSILRATHSPMARCSRTMLRWNSSGAGSAQTHS
ncbi:hypothetical protein ACWGH8_37850 [Nonomuraea muscovyensis]